jgi:hypothetical protein
MAILCFSKMKIANGKVFTLMQTFFSAIFLRKYLKEKEFTKNQKSPIFLFHHLKS